MSTDTQPVAALLEQAEAIVEAEWMRLTLDDDIDECALIAPFDETPAPRPRPPRVDTQRPCSTVPAHHRRATPNDGRRGAGPGRQYGQPSDRPRRTPRFLSSNAVGHWR
jgi:hypothetical protein